MIKMWQKGFCFFSFSFFYIFRVQLYTRTTITNINIDNQGPGPPRFNFYESTSMYNPGEIYNAITRAGFVI